jgi:hypothetical protein
MLYLRVLFFLLFVLEVRQLNFKHSRDKYIWLGIVLVFGYFGYAFFLVYKRRLLTKRRFSPDFGKRKVMVAKPVESIGS